MLKTVMNMFWLSPYKHVRFGFDKLKSIVSVEREDDSLYVHVYRENWDPVRSYFYTRPIAIINHELYDELLAQSEILGRRPVSSKIRGYWSG